MTGERVCAACKKPLVRTVGPDGKPDDHVIEYLDGTVVHAECVPKELLLGKDE